jgi:hypothetical protein
MIISAMPMDVPYFKNKNENDESNLPGTRVNADGQTQISLSKFKIDMPGSVKVQDKRILDQEQASFFDPTDAGVEQTFQRHTTT